MFDAGGAVDRKAVAARVFGDEAALERLESILLPRVREGWERQLAQAGERRAIVEIPLLFEKKLEKLFDLSVCVTASHETQLRRLAGRGYTAAEALARIAKQLPTEEKEKRSALVITNNGSPAFTEQQVIRFIRSIQ
jgi:dephospho-CoA kinase